MPQSAAPSTPLLNVTPWSRLRPSPYLPQVSLLAFSLPSREITGKGSPMLISRGGGKRGLGGPSSRRRAPPSPRRHGHPPACCPLFVLPVRGAADSASRGLAALRRGAEKLQSRFPAARLFCGTACGADLSQPHALLPTTRSRLLLCLHDPCAFGCRELGSSPRRGPPRAPSRSSWRGV